MMKFFIEDKDVLEEIESLEGEIVIRMKNGEVNINRSCDLRSLCFMFSSFVGMIYGSMRKGIKPEVENPEEEITDVINHLVEMGIEKQKINDRMEALRDNPSTDVFLEILQTALEAVAKNRKKCAEKGGDSK